MVAMQVEFDILLRDQFQFILALLILVVGGVAGHLIGRLNRRLLNAAGVPEAVERTPFERTADRKSVV